MTMTMTTFPSDLWWHYVTLRAQEPPLCQSPLFLFSPGSRLAKLPFDFCFAMVQVFYSHFGIFFVSIHPREKFKKVAIRPFSDNIQLFSFTYINVLFIPAKFLFAGHIYKKMRFLHYISVQHRLFWLTIEKMVPLGQMSTLTTFN